MNTKQVTNEENASNSTKKTMAKNVPTKNFDETQPKSSEAKAHVKGEVDPQGTTKPEKKAPTKENDKASKGLSPDAKKHVKGNVDPQGATKSQIKPPVKPFEKAKIKENETIKNAASKHLLGMKSDNHEENMVKAPAESDPGKEKMALNTTGTVTKREHNSSIPKVSLPSKETKAQKVTGPAATKQEYQVGKAKESLPSKETKAQKGTEPKATKQEYQVKSAPVKQNDKAVKPVSKDATNHIAGGKTEVKGKSETPNMKESETFMKTRAGAKGKVFENTENEESETIDEDDNWLNEMSDDSWLNETEEADDETVTENEEMEDEHVNEVEEDEEDEEDVKKLNEQIVRMKQIFKY